MGSGEIHYYKISALFGSRGEGPKSAPVNATTGTPPPAYATVNMGTGTLDADFTDGTKAAWSTDSLLSVGYSIAGLYVANDTTNLYVALDFGSNPPGGYTYDRLIVLIDNTSSSTGNADTSTKVAQTQSFESGSSLEGYVMQRMNSTVSGTTNVACNVTAWTGGDADPWVWKPAAPSGATTVKFSIPLANIAGATAGNILKVFAAFSQGWENGTNIRVGDIIPSAAASGTSKDDAAITIDMTQALAYTVK